jgi:hypothetical protein
MVVAWPRSRGEEAGQMKTRSEQRRNAGRVVLGATLIVVGAALLLGRMEILDIEPLWRWYPLILISLGVAKLWQTWGTLAAGSGLWLALTGLWLLGVNFKVLGMTYANSFPALLVAIGASMVVRSVLAGSEPGRGRDPFGGEGASQNAHAARRTSEPSASESSRGWNTDPDRQTPEGEEAPHGR